MFVNPGAEFEDIVAYLAPTRQIETDARGPYVLEPVFPSVGNLVDYHADFLSSIADGTDDSAISTEAATFLTNVAEFLDIRPGEEVNIKGVRSFTAENEPGQHKWLALDFSVEVYGAFHGLWIGNWFDLPHGEQFTPEGYHQYLRRHGLLAVVDNPHLLRPDGVVGKLRPGHTFIPLNHQNPEMYKVLRESANF